MNNIEKEWKSNKNLRIASLFLIGFNLIDAIFTHIWIQLKLATEANPIMACFYNLNPIFFFVVKLSLIFGSLLMFLFVSKQRPSVVWIVHILVLLYAFIVLYHCFYLVFCCL